MIETILLAFLVAKLKKYKLGPLFKSWAFYPVILFTLLFVYFQVRIFQGDYSVLYYSSIYKILYLLSLLVLVIRYKQYIASLIGSCFVVAGSILNNTAIAANGGKMPVYPTLSYITGYIKPDTFEKADKLHVLGTSATKMAFLTDYIDLGYNVLSIGDVLIRVFTFIAIYCSIACINREKANYHERNVEMNA